MPSIASSSRARTRTPLISLPLTTFIQPIPSSSSSFPSPISLPSKRGPSSLSVPSSPGSTKTRKVSRTEMDGSETVRKARVATSGSGKGKGKEQVDEDERAVEVGVTPRIKNVLEKDDLGVGKSPARRLFVDDRESPISGISGAITTPPKSHRGLAPSPPISDSPFIVSTPTSTSDQDEIEIDVQAAPSPSLPSSSLPLEPGSEPHCGFTIYQSTSTELRELDEFAASQILQLTSSAGQSLTPSPSVSEIDLNNIENQENLQPLSLPLVNYPPSPNSKSRSNPNSNRTTPSKYSSGTSTADDEIISMYLSAPSTNSSISGTSASGSGTRRRERSKLINEVLLLRGENVREKEDKMNVDVDAEEEEELTPGKKIIKGGRERLRREVNMA
ncbi:uncharacterized protein L199_002764 [Kwoniella botswanensis]|uniref:uncharacterized protein n=1 Tax=Kwoniella botswanensis TaxID=1268659 RepID=UPI00315D7C70